MNDVYLIESTNQNKGRRYQMLDFQSNDYNFEVEERPVIVEGLGVLEDQKALVRADTNTFLGQHPKGYKLIKNDTIVNAQYEAIKEADISQDFDFSVTCLDGGRKLKIDVLFNDLVIEPEVGDTVQFRTTTFNSYDGSWKYQNQADGYRLICKNGMCTSSLISKISAKHTSQINITGAAEVIRRSLEVFNDQKDVWSDYTKNKVSRSNVEEFFKTTVCHVPQKSTDELFNKKQLNNLLGHYDEYKRSLGANQWSVYNALTHWSTHTGEARIPAVTTRYREGKVIEAMQSSKWLALAS